MIEGCRWPQVASGSVCAVESRSAPFPNCAFELTVSSTIDIRLETLFDAVETTGLGDACLEISRVRIGRTDIALCTLCVGSTIASSIASCYSAIDTGFGSVFHSVETTSGELACSVITGL